MEGSRTTRSVTQTSHGTLQFKLLENVPQSSLFLVPFLALQDEQGKYLIEKHTILTAPAIQVLDLTRQQRQRVSGNQVLVIGNPIMPSVSPKIGEPPKQLDNLPGAETEAKEIAQLFNTKAITGAVSTSQVFAHPLRCYIILLLPSKRESPRFAQLVGGGNQSSQ